MSNSDCGEGNGGVVGCYENGSHGGGGAYGNGGDCGSGDGDYSYYAIGSVNDNGTGDDGKERGNCANLCRKQSRLKLLCIHFKSSLNVQNKLHEK